MKMRIPGVFLILFLLITIPAFSQETESEGGGQTDKRDFFLIPVLEAIFSGNPRWSPDWPSDVPPDGFSLPSGNPQPGILELSNGDETLVLTRDGEGRLLEFPFFYKDGYAKVKTEYSLSGVLKTMSIVFKNISAQDETWDIAFPPDFLPYSELSPGGSFPVLRVSTGDSDFFVFIFESPIFLTETWYDSGGNMLAFCKASVDVENGAWRTRSLQIHGESGISFEDRFFDSFGNITEIHYSSDGLQDRRALALYRDSMPTYWRFDDLWYELQWDTRGILTIIKAWDESGGLDAEYRYGYETDAFGIWVRREEAAYRIQFDLITPQPSYSRGIWSRRLEYFETGAID